MSSSPQIFFSYAWGDENEQGESREKIVTELYQSLLHDHYRVLRDKNNLEYKGFISEFMGRIGKGECIVVAISKKYVRSPYCMFELYEIARNSNFDKHRFREKVIPVMVEFVDFTDPAIIDDHFSFWENEYKEWDDLLKKRTGQLSVEQMQRYDKIKMIYQNFGRLTEWIIDMNTLNPQLLSANNFAEIKKAIIKKGTEGELQEHRPPRRLLKMPVFWISAIAAVAAIILIASWLSGTWNTQSTSPFQSALSFSLVRPAGEQLLIVQDLNTKRFGYARVKDTSLFISCKYEEANPFKEKIALVKIYGKYHWIKPDSTDAFNGQYDYAEDFQKGKAKIFDGKDSFYINKNGERLPLPVVHTPKDTGKINKEQTVTPPNEPPPVKPCKAICDTKGITGVEVSFIDSRNHKKYVKVSDGNDMEFDIPCYLLEDYVRVTFRGKVKSDYQNVRLKEFEIPELFKTNQ